MFSKGIDSYKFTYFGQLPKGVNNPLKNLKWQQGSSGILFERFKHFFLQWCYFFLILSYNFFKNTFQSFRLKIIFILLNVRNMYCWPPVVIKSLISVTSKILQYIRFILVSMWLNILENNTVGPRILIYLKNTFIVKIIKNELNMSEMFFQHYTTSIYQFIK